MSIEDIAKWFATNPWAIIVLALCTIGGLVFGIVSLWLYFKGKKVRLLSYTIRSTVIFKGLTNEIPELDIHFHGHGESIENLTSSNILLWNRGRETIRKADVVKGHPITIMMAENCSIVRVSILFGKTPANQIAVTRSADKTKAAVNSEYLDFMDGAIINILHTGVGNDALVVTGVVMGGGGPKRVEDDRSSKSLASAARIIVYYVMPVSTCIVTWFVLESALDYMKKDLHISVPSNLYYGSVLFGFLFVGIAPLILLTWLLKRLLDRRIPIPGPYHRYFD
jgi:hypothetical protein